MKQINLANLKDAANRLLFDMSDIEYQTLLKEFDTISAQMNIIAEDKSVDEYTPMVFPFPCEVTSLREDMPVKPRTREEMLKNAKNKVAGQIKLPKVVS